MNSFLLGGREFFFGGGVFFGGSCCVYIYIYNISVGKATRKALGGLESAPLVLEGKHIGSLER